jgi:hypothetical protein
MTIATRNGGRALPCLSNFFGTVAYTDVKSLYRLPKFNVHPDWHARGMPMACILYQSRLNVANDTDDRGLLARIDDRGASGPHHCLRASINNA